MTRLHDITLSQICMFTRQEIQLQHVLVLALIPTHIDNDIKYLTFEAMWPHGCGYQQSLSCLQAACVQIDRSM